MKKFYLEITAPEEIGPVYNEEKDFDSEREAQDYLEWYSDGKVVKTAGPIGNPGVGSELAELGFKGLYELCTDTRFIGAVYERIGA